MSHGSPLSINYEKLESLLSHGLWKEADQETNQLLEKIKTVETRRLDQDFSFRASDDIKIIDKLRTNFSKNHFGLSVQYEIYKSWGGLDNLYKTKPQVWSDFCKEVGWYKQGPPRVGSQGPVISDNALIFSLDAPRGHLPSFVKRTEWNQFGEGRMVDFSGNKGWQWNHIIDRLNA